MIRYALVIICDKCGRSVRGHTGPSAMSTKFEAEDGGSLRGWELPKPGDPANAPVLCGDCRKEPR